MATRDPGSDRRDRAIPAPRSGGRRGRAVARRRPQATRPPARGRRASGGGGSRGREPRAAAPGLDGGLAGGAAGAVDVRLVRRQVERPERPERVDAAGRRAVSVWRPPLRSTSTRHSTISPPSASTAGIIASSEPPVVRMSSTRMTFSPGWISKPRRNSRRGPSSLATSSAKIARVPSWRPVSKARITPPVVGPATRSTSAVPSLRTWVPTQNEHSSLVASGSWSTWNFSRYASLWRPLLRMKWPSRSAPLLRNSASVRWAITRRAASSMDRRRVVIAVILGRAARDRLGVDDFASPGSRIGRTRRLATPGPRLAARADPRRAVR